MLAFATLKLIKQVVSNGVSPESTRLVSAALLKNDSACSAVVFDTSYTACDSAVLPLQERSNTAFCSVYADISSPYCSIMPSEALSLTGFTVRLMILLSFSGVWLMTTQYNTIWFMYFPQLKVICGVMQRFLHPFVWFSNWFYLINVLKLPHII